jgi:hypothetical protein
MRTAHYVRLAALLAAAAVALHQLLSGFAAGLLPLLAVLVMSVALATLIRGTESASPARAPLARRIAAFSIVLLMTALLAGGGWIALPLAVAFGVLAALLARALEGLEQAIAVVHAERPARSRAPAVRGRPLPARVPRLASAPLAFGLARRPPPLTPA